jgi:hypothetical protein
MGFLPVVASEQDWFLAIGSEDRHDADDVELQRCCANVSAIRDWLFKCKKDGGLVESDVIELRHITLHHEPPRDQDKLKNILAQLGIEWSE